METAKVRDNLLAVGGHVQLAWLVGIRLMAAFIGFASMLILGLVLLLVYPMFARRVTATIRGCPHRPPKERLINSPLH